MPGLILTEASTVNCKHQGPASPALPIVNRRVTLSGSAVIVQTDAYLVSGCTLGSGRCVSATWITAAMRVRVGGVPVILKDSQALTAPNPTGLSIILTQQRVKGA